MDYTIYKNIWFWIRQDYKGFNKPGLTSIFSIYLRKCLTQYTGMDIWKTISLEIYSSNLKFVNFADFTLYRANTNDNFGTKFIHLQIRCTFFCATMHIFLCIFSPQLSLKKPRRCINFSQATIK